MSTSWLNKQRKQALLDLSTEAGLEQNEDSRKDEIVAALDDYLQANATRLARNATFDPYYGSTAARSKTPHKARSSSGAAAAARGASEDGEVRSVVRGRGRRATRVKQEFEESDPVSSPAPAATTSIHDRSASSSTARKTPGRPPRRSFLPPSPADVADLAEYETTQLYAGLNDLYTLSGIPETVDSLRDACSSVAGIQGAFLLLETLALQAELLPWIYGFEITGVRGLGLPRVSVYYPDLFLLLTPSFWLPTLLWTLTSLVIPATLAYFFNLTVRTVRRGGARVSVARYAIDPLTFNIVKALATWMVYSQGVGANYIDPAVISRVNYAMLGGYQGVLIGCYVVILAAVYDAAQRK